MEINKKSRTELKAYFVKNALPTVGNFSDLIDAALNQKDDGLAKSADQPVQIAASTAGDKPAIHLYESFATDTKPAWVLSLQVGDKKGLGIGDGDGHNRLFIDGATGDVGIGTADPAGYKLHVAGNTRITGTLTAGEITQEGWKSPTLRNSWVLYGSNYNIAGYFKDSCGVVHLRGLIKNGTFSGSPPTGTIFQLPAGYRPQYRQLFMASTYLTDSTNGAARVDIDTDGNVLAYSGNSGWLCLDGITFRAV